MMESFLIYLGRVALAMGAFYITFMILFQKQKHFRFNRIYLLASMAVSYLIPLITITITRKIEAAPVQTFINYNFDTNISATVEVQEYFWYHYATAILAVGVLGFISHFLIGSFRALKIIRKSKYMSSLGKGIFLTADDIHPFSFFNKIVISEKALNHPDIKMILAHEILHVKEWHTLDIVVAEVLFFLQWFNPFAWLLRDAVKNNLEFITDEHVIRHNDRKKYQLAMVSLADKKGVAPFLTALNGSQLKTRIIMMKKKTENKFAIVKQLTVIPLLTLLIIGLSNKEFRAEIVNPEETEISDENSAKTPKVIIDGEEIPSDYKNLGRIDFSQQIDGQEIMDAIELNPENVVSSHLDLTSSDQPLFIIQTNEYIEGSDPEFEKLLNVKFKFHPNRPPGKLLYTVDEKLVSREEFFIAAKKGFAFVKTVSGEEIMKKYGEEGEGTVVQATSGGDKFLVKHPETGIESEGMTSELNNNFSDEEQKLSRADTTNTKDKVIVTGYKANKIEFRISEEFKGKEGNPLYVVDREIRENIESIQPDSIESISVLKDESATVLYGEKGKNGVILINTKNGIKNSKQEPGKVYSIVDEIPEFPGGETSLRKYIDNSIRYPEIARENGIEGKVYVTFVVGRDGYVKDAKIQRGVDPSLDKEALRIISSLPIWKPGKFDGKPVNTYFTVPVNFKLDSEEKTTINVRGIGTIDNKNPLVIIDGEPKGKLKNEKGSSIFDKLNLDPDDIESINILKDGSASELYGEDAKDGAILVTTKKSKLLNNSDINDFLILIENEDDLIKIKGIKGCAFKEISFTLRNDKVQAFDQNGMTILGKEREIRDSDLADFLFTIKRIENGLSLEGIRGTSWKKLAFNFPEKNFSQLINQDGMVKGN